MEVHNDVASTFRRKGLQKRHSIASCLKQNNSRPPLKRRVSFSKRKTLHLISKEQQKKQWIPSPKDDTTDKENKPKDDAETEEFLALKPIQTEILEEPDDFEGLDDTEILNETMAIDFTTDFSAQFLDLSAAEEDTTLSNLIEQDDTLSLPTNYIDTTVNDTNSSNGSTSEITFLGGQIEQSEDCDPYPFSEQENTGQIMDLGNETEEFFATENAFSKSIVIDLDDDDFSEKFNILDQLSQKLEISTSLTEPIANLIEADQQEAEDLSKIIPFDEIAPDEEDKTENFLLDNTETFLAGQNISGLMDFSGTTSGRRATPVQTPLNLHRNESGVSEPLRVDDFLSSVHIHFRIFDTMQKNSLCGTLLKAEEMPTYTEEDILVAFSEKKLVLEARLRTLESKNDYFESQIMSTKQEIEKLSDLLDKNNPKCFESTILSRKQFKTLKDQTQTFAKYCWYDNRIKAHQQYQLYLEKAISALWKETERAQQQFVSVDYPTASTSILDGTVVSKTEIETLREQLDEISEEYEVLSSLTEWKLSQSSNTEFSFVYHEQYRLLVTMDERSSASLECLQEISPFEKTLIAYVEKLCIVPSVKALPNVLENISIWIGRVDDILEECARIQQNNVQVELYVTQTKQATLETIFAWDSSPVRVTWFLDLPTYPQLRFECTDTEISQQIDMLLQEVNEIEFSYGRLEELCSRIAQLLY